MTERKRSILFYGGISTIYVLLSYTTELNKTGLLLSLFVVMGFLPKPLKIEPLFKQKYRTLLGFIFLLTVIVWIVFGIDR